MKKLIRTTDGIEFTFIPGKKAGFGVWDAGPLANKVHQVPVIDGDGVVFTTLHHHDKSFTLIARHAIRLRQEYIESCRGQVDAYALASREREPSSPDLLAENERLKAVLTQIVNHPTGGTELSSALFRDLARAALAGETA